MNSESTSSQAAFPDHERLARILDDYLVAIEQGRSISPEELLAQYPEIATELAEEPSAAAAAREALNARIGEWVTPFDGLSATQTRQLRQVLVANRANLAVAPWKENNGY